jgi:integrase
MKLQTQAVEFMAGLEARKLRPAKPATIKLYDSYIRNHINPYFGNMEIEDIKNAVMKQFAAKLISDELSPATITGVMTVTKRIISSAVNDEGELLFPKTWNHRFIGAPQVNPRKQKTPIISAEGVQDAINKADGQYKALIALYAGTGLRMSEALAIKRGPDDGKGSFWSPEDSLLKIRSQVQYGVEQDPKTEAGTREVDIPKELNSFLLSVLGTEPGLVFKSKHNGFINKTTAYQVAEETGIPGYHSCRRFRVTHLRSCQMPEDILEYWIGHGGGVRTITDRYSKLAQNTTLRKEWAEKAGIGFELPELRGN